MFDDLYEKLRALGRRIRAIWIADLAHQGQSYIINEKVLGNDRMPTHHLRLRISRTDQA
jgi:hypothetical protein